MKKLFVVLILSIMCIIPCSVNAQSKSYRTVAGVVVDKTLYDKMCELYSTHYVETLSQEEFDNLASTDLDNAIKVEYVEDTSNNRGSYFSSSSKSVSFIKSGDWVTLIADWFVVPSVHSFDVMAFRMSGCSLVGNVTFRQTYVSSGNLYYVHNGNDKYFTNGFGTSALLQYGTDNEFSMTFKVSGSGTIYGTYQHAMGTISLADSMNYSLSSGGFGRVLNFGTVGHSIYDRMTGVDISF